MLYTFIENYKYKFEKEPLLKSIKDIAEIISWNVWQMDGLKGIVPLSCGEIKTKTSNLSPADANNFKHNGIYCLIMDWSETDLKGKKIKFIDLFKINISQ